MENRTDEELMVLVAKGDEEAFGVIVRRFLPKAISYTGKFFGTTMDSDEIIQDTFVRMWKYAIKWKPSKGKVKTWFYGILSNMCYTYAKKNKHHLNSDDIKNIDDDSDIEAMLVKKQECFYVRDKVKRLNEREQQVIILTYFEEYSNRRTADIMGTTVKAVETLLTRTKRKLRKFCEEQDER